MACAAPASVAPETAPQTLTMQMSTRTRTRALIAGRNHPQVAAHACNRRYGWRRDRLPGVTGDGTAEVADPVGEPPGRGARMLGDLREFFAQQVDRHALQAVGHRVRPQARHDVVAVEAVERVDHIDTGKVRVMVFPLCSVLRCGTPSACRAAGYGAAA
jgi:hypothetical protein